MKVVYEIHSPEKGWRRVGEQPEGTLGSLSSLHPTRGRQVYMFGWRGKKGPALWRSNGGGDIEEGMSRLVIHTMGLKKLVTLSKNPHVRIIYNPHYGPVRVRFKVES